MLTNNDADISQDVDRLNAVINYRLEALASAKAADAKLKGIVTDQKHSHNTLFPEQESGAISSIVGKIPRKFKLRKRRQG